MSTTYKLEELARAADVAPRTVRYYVQRGLLPAPEFKGRDTSYGRGHLSRLRAIKRLQAAGLPLDAIEARLAGSSEAELDQLARADVLEVELPRQAPPPAGSRHARASAPACGVRQAERWERVVLAPGLELFVKAAADPETRRVAREIEALTTGALPPNPRRD